MDASSPEHRTTRVLVLQSLLAGATLGVVALAGASQVLFPGTGLLVGSAGLIATMMMALAVGLWAGAPVSQLEEVPHRQRWMGVALATAAAGAGAVLLTLNRSLSLGAPGRMLALLVLVGIPAYTVGLLLPTLAEWAQREDESLDEAREGDWGAVGVVAVAVLAGVVLGVLATGALALPRWGAGYLLLGTSVVLLLPLLLPDSPASDTEERVLLDDDTPFGTLRVTEVVYPNERQPERRLYVNGEEESGELVRSGAPTLAYIAAAERFLSELGPRAGSYLFLGGGAYTLPRRVAERDPRARITVVELDPAVTRAAYRFFGVRPEHGIRTVNGDARAYLERQGLAGSYDRIYVDVYSGHEALPYSLVTLEAFTALRARLAPQGVAALNVIGVAHGPESLRFWSVVRTFCEVFPTVSLLSHLGPDFPDRQNFLLAGTLDPALPPRGAAGLFEPWPRDQWPGWEGTRVFRDLLTSEGAPGVEARTPPEPGAELASGSPGGRSARPG